MSTASAQWGQLDPRQFWLHGKEPDEPVSFDEQSGMWNVYGHQEVLDVLADTTTFSSDTARLVPIEGEFSRGNLLKMDPPEHHKLRKLVGHAFTSKMISGLEPRIVELTHELLDKAVDRGRMEVVEDLAYPLPVIVIADLLGLPNSDRDLFKQWVGEVFERPEGFTRGEPTPQSTQNAVDQMGKLIAYLHEHATERRTKPRNDLLTRLVEAQVDGERLSDTEVANFGAVLLIAGHITTTMLLGNTVLCMETFREAREAVQSDRTRIPGMIEESLRYLSSFAAISRCTNQPGRIGDKSIEADQLVLLWLAAANRDPRRFERPHEFDITRSPNPHLAFGHGVHFCIGTQLARMEGRVAMNVLFDRFPRFRMDPDDAPRFQPSPYMTGVTRLSLLTD
ncbi:cytochrome P450 [Streptomyces albidoflavus]